ncbi:ribose 1,5-bisphosphokinase [Neorhizobium galegae]|uniref:phosphonate metabolism protein/1,5-bisphosphokinase (PRPP-forming) PhnN n=1 Tax=Neorhizobium galegae TaxID=399 RepID=UPI001AE5C5D4|nr:phosphonate metabolism protein/1,5-bisphosphokinase (PRPP-forming) PhnN [Neorhizobium galegae]MBP2548446.1 ribose 1,5-bisphosphokinase [Neorhizobium galegae]
MAVVVGPSGAGKDTLIGYAAAYFTRDPRVSFVRRCITRDASAGGEDHEGMTPEGFLAAEQAGEFAVSWHAHGLHYGIPRRTKEALAAGQLLVANGSRSALPLFQAAYDRLLVINITARPDILAERLMARGRETRDDILARLQRATLPLSGDYRVATIDNSDSVEKAGAELVGILTENLTPPSNQPVEVVEASR